MVKVQILSTPGCTKCAAVISLFKRIQEDSPDLVLEEIDVTEHPEVASRYMLMAAPGIVIDGKLEFVGGVPKEEQLRAKLGI